MSWLYSRALAEEFSEVCSLDGELSAPSRLTPTPLAYWSHGKTTAHSRLSRFGMTLERLTDDRGEELLTWYRAGFRAKTSAQPAKAQALTENAADYGESLRGFLGRFDPATHSLKTAQSSLLADSTECLVILPRWGLMHDGELYRQRTPARLTSAKESGLWPTPRNNTGPSTDAKHLSLDGAVRLFPTPTAADSHGHQYQRDRGQKGKERPTLVGVATGWLPTSNTVDAKGGTRTVAGQVQLCRTVGGKLNPRWVEWLMGWPIGWVSLEPLVMDKFQQWLGSHGSY